ncbi:MAG: DUF5615 family PIN-like protein [Reyranellaceae bacterium]
MADESLDGRVEAGLSALGLDIERARRGAADLEVLGRAAETGRTLVTEDKDFGDLVVHRSLPSESVVLVRLDNVPIEERVRLVRAALSEIESAKGPVFIVVSPNNTRTRPILRSV